MAQQTISKMETVQTAVDWLIEQLHSESYQNAFGRTYVSPVIIDEAKAMEKEQIEKAIDDALNAYGIIKKH